MATQPETTQEVTVFAATWCPYCAKLLSGLKEKNVPFEGWDVDKHPEFDEWIKSVNDGNRIVPTVLYSDGTTATNPPAADVLQKYQELRG